MNSPDKNDNSLMPADPKKGGFQKKLSICPGGGGGSAAANDGGQEEGEQKDDEKRVSPQKDIEVCNLGEKPKANSNDNIGLP